MYSLKGQPPLQLRHCKQVKKSVPAQRLIFWENLKSKSFKDMGTPPVVFME
jgi:hypothetical protein